MALFEDDGYLNKPEYRDLFVKDGECLVKGVVFMGTPFRGSGQATLFKPFIKAIRQLNLVTAVNDSFLGALNGDQPIEVTHIVHRFQTVMNVREIKVIICCEEKPVAGSSLVCQPNEMRLFWTVHTRACLKTLLITRWQLTSITFPDDIKSVGRSHFRRISPHNSYP